MTAEEANLVYGSSVTAGETFRQKDWRMYHILNLVLYDNFLELLYFIRAKDRKDDCTHDCV